MKITRVQGAAVALTTVALATIAPVTAPKASAMCSSNNELVLSSPVHHTRDLVSPAYVPQPHHTLTISLASGKTQTATRSGSMEIGLGEIIADAKATYGRSYATSVTTQTTYTDSYPVPSTWTHGGYLHAGSYYDSIHWAYGHYTGRCVWVTGYSGTVNLPFAVPAFWATKA